MFMTVFLPKSVKRAERVAWDGLVTALILLLAVSALNGIWAKSFAVNVAIIPLALSSLCFAIAAWRAYLVRKEEEESEERQRVMDQYDRDDLFNDREDALRMAETARTQFDKWGIPAFTLLMGIGVLLSAWMVHSHYSDLLLPDSAKILAQELAARKSVDTLGFCLCGLIVTCLLGVYWNGTSRETGCRYMRPAAQWLIIASAVFGIAVVLTGVEFLADKNDDWQSTRHLDVRVSVYLLYLFIAFGVQILLNVLMEIYRPRALGAESRPLYESRLVGLLTEPGGIARNVAYTLDYQFGFKVSETWFYRFFEKGVLPFIMALILCLYLLDCIVLVDAREKAIKTRFGKVVDVYEPGFHLKMPWPYHRVKVYSVRETHQVKVGFVAYKDEAERKSDASMEEEGEHGPSEPGIIVWDKKHYKTETNFLVPSRSPVDTTEKGEKEAGAEPGEGKKKDKLPVMNFLSCAVSVFYKIREGSTPEESRKHLLHYAYNYEDPDATIKAIATREVVNYLASADLLDVVTTKNAQAQEVIGRRVRDAVAALEKDDQRALGVEIASLAIEGAHPPVEVAEAFQSVATAEQERLMLEHQAWSYRYQTVEGAKSQKYKIIADAEAYRNRKEKLPKHEIAEFRAQLKNYRIAPEVFKMRAYLDVLEALAKRKDIPVYIVATRHAKNVTEVRYPKRTPGIGDVEIDKPDKD